MADYFETLSCTGTGTPTLTSTPEKILSALGTGVSSYILQPMIVFSIVAVGTVTRITDILKTISAVVVSVNTVSKNISRTLSATGTLTSSLLKLPGKVFSTSAISDAWIFAERFGASAFDELECARKWFEDEVGKWSATVTSRFLYYVRGRL